MRVRASIEINGQCPYCGYSWSIELHDVRGQNFAERCLDCGELFVVETLISIDARTLRAVSRRGHLRHVPVLRARHREDESCCELMPA